MSGTLEIDDLSKLGVAILGERIIVRPDRPDDMVGEDSDTDFWVHKSGALINKKETVEKESTSGVVIGVGEGEWFPVPGPTVEGPMFVRKPMLVKVGQRIVHSKFGFQEVKIAGVLHRIVKQYDVHFIVPDGVEIP